MTTLQRLTRAGAISNGPSKPASIQHAHAIVDVSPSPTPKQTFPTPSPGSTYAPGAGQLLTLQRQIGNRAVQRLLKRPSKLSQPPSSALPLQRFESNEHRHLGDEGTRGAQGQTATLELAPGYFISFGEMTAMAGDFFRSVDEMKRLASNPSLQGAGTREELEYVRQVKVAGKSNLESSFSAEARSAVDQRYYELAGNNSAHFTEPRGQTERTSANNRGNYRDNHEQAIRLGVAAGAAKSPINDALLYEGFASHFLTDAYSAGHMRTERISIVDWWNPRVPMFWTNLKLFIAERLAYYINEHTTIAGGLQSIDSLWETVRETIDQKRLPTLTFGDLISGACHDYDNEKGVDSQHGILLGDGQLMSQDGKNSLLPGGQDTAARAIEAVRTSRAELDRAYELGGSGTTPEQVIAQLMTDGTYAAEKIWPQALPDAQQTPERAEPNWKKNTVEELLADSVIQEAIKIFSAEKAATLEGALTFDDVKKLGITVVSASIQAQGFKEGLTNRLRTDPIPLMQDIINYTPKTGGGVGGHNTDDNATEYVSMARQTPNGLASLTVTQGINLIRDLIGGSCDDDDEATIIELIQPMDSSKMLQVVQGLGGGDAQKGIDFLDSGVDGEEWSTLSTLLRREPELAKLL